MSKRSSYFEQKFDFDTREDLERRLNCISSMSGKTFLLRNIIIHYITTALSNAKFIVQDKAFYESYKREIRKALIATEFARTLQSDEFIETVYRELFKIDESVVRIYTKYLPFWGQKTDWDYELKKLFK